MAPIKSSLARTVSKLLGVSKDTDLTLRGNGQISRKPLTPLVGSGGNLANGLEPGNGYKYHTFGTPGNFVVSGDPGIIDILIVAGGGAGGNNRGAGGGAGGIVHHSQLLLDPGTYPVAVGDGGAQPGTGEQEGASGTDSTFAASPSPVYLIAKGGGGGGDNSGPESPGNPGGSGGGANYVGTTPPMRGLATQGGPNSGQNPSFHGASGFNQYGNNGGLGSGGPKYNSAGGGGAGGVGGNGTTGSGSNAAGDGGAGQAFPDFTGPVIGVPALNPLSGVYGGGGGASCGSENGYNPPIAPAGTGGPGGGGPGGGAGAGDQGIAGVQYSGSGGGGGHRSPENTRGGAGGDGLVVIRYAV